MFLKTFGLGVPLVLGGLYFSGGLGGGYSRDVGASQARVMAALTDLDVREQPGSPGTDPSRSGGVRPTFQLERGTDSMTWTVMSGDKVATRMTAHFAPINEGHGTRVTASVERGDAPDDFVSPAFRSKGLTLGLFTMALESELNELAVPRWGPHCDAMTEEWRMAGFQSGSATEQPDSLSSAVGKGAKDVIRLNAMYGEMMAAGCNPDAVKSGTVASKMGSPSARPVANVSFQAGKPMVDLSRDR